MRFPTCFRSLSFVLIVLGFVYLAPSRATADDPEESDAGLGFMHPLQVDPGVLQHCPHPATAFCRLHTYIFFINGVDPGNLGNLYGLTLFVKAHGYPQTYFGQMYHGNHYLTKIRHIHHHDPHARFVLIGFSGGAYTVRSMANALCTEGIHVDLLTYIGGDMIYNDAHSQPDNAARILNITGHGFAFTGGNLFFNGDNLERALNIRIPVRHFALPSHRDTIQALMSELSNVACAIPVAPPVTPLAIQTQEQ